MQPCVKSRMRGVEEVEEGLLSNRQDVGHLVKGWGLSGVCGCPWMGFG